MRWRWLGRRTTNWTSQYLPWIWNWSTRFKNSDMFGKRRRLQSRLHIHHARVMMQLEHQVAHQLANNWRWDDWKLLSVLALGSGYHLQRRAQMGMESASECPPGHERGCKYTLSFSVNCSMSVSVPESVSSFLQSLVELGIIWLLIDPSLAFRLTHPSIKVGVEKDWPLHWRCSRYFPNAHLPWLFSCMSWRISNFYLQTLVFSATEPCFDSCQIKYYKNYLLIGVVSVPGNQEFEFELFESKIRKMERLTQLLA